VNHFAMERADVAAVGVFGLIAAQRARAVRSGQAIAGVFPFPDLLEAFPDGIALAVPTEFVALDQIPRREAADDHPRQKTFAG
jgi:hypothetical protein